MGNVVLGHVRGAPGSLCVFRRNFGIVVSPSTASERRIKIRATGCCSKFLCCSFFNSFYLDEFVILDADGDEIGWIRKVEKAKGGGASVEFAQNIGDDDTAKGLILVAAVTLVSTCHD